MATIVKNSPELAATTTLIMAAILLNSLYLTDAQIGVCYGRKGNNLPCAEDVLNLFDFNGIEAMRLYDPDLDTLNALQQTWITLILGVLNEDIISLASDQSNADTWVQNNVVPFSDSIKYISVGNEIHPGDPQAPFVQKAMQNILNSLNSNKLANQIRVSTAVDTTLITNSYPPSNSHFINLTYITPIINFLLNNDSPLLVNIQPYHAYINDPKNIKLDYALFNASGDVFTDYNNGLKYQNLFDAIYDAMYIATDKVTTSFQPLSLGENGNGKNQQRKKKKVKIVVSESGWPSKGGFSGHGKKKKGRKLSNNDELQLEGGEAATVKNAKIYYTNLINHVKKGTPLTPGQAIETYLFAMFDENQKPGDVSERNFGLFNPVDQEPKYGDLDFCTC